MTCRSNLNHGNYNSDGGLKVCRLKLLSCEATCSNNTNSSKLRLEYKLAKIEYESMKRRAKLEERYKDIDEKYDRRIARVDERSKKRCIRNTKERIDRSYNHIIDPTWDDRRRHRRALEAVTNDC